MRYAVGGAVAVAARGVPRTTADFDFFTADARVFDSGLWAELQKDDIPVEIRKGDFDDPLAGVVRIGREHEVDVVVGKWKWELAIIERAEPVDIEGAMMPVPLTGDLILLKVVAGGRPDVIDAMNLLDFGPREALIAEVTAHIAELPESLRGEVEKTWRSIVDE